MARRVQRSLKDALSSPTLHLRGLSCEGGDSGDCSQGEKCGSGESCGYVPVSRSAAQAVTQARRIAQAAKGLR